MSEDKKNIIYTAKDIEAYFSGKLSGSQMHTMEKDALDDPFLAEAMEGYEAMQGKDWNSQLAALHQQFAEIRLPAKVVPLNRSTGRWWKVAAAVLLIGSGATLTWWLTKEKEVGSNPDQIARLTTTPQKDPDTTIAATTTVSTPEKKLETAALTSPESNGTDANKVIGEDKTPVTRLLSQVNPVRNADSSAVFFKYNAKPASSGDLAKTEGTISTEERDKNKTYAATTPSPATPALNNNNNIAGNNSIAGKEAHTRETTSKAIETAKNNEVGQGFFSNDEDTKKKTTQGPSLNKTTSTVNRNFIEQVVGPDNSPLPFANINIKNENFGTNADVNGNFRLVSTDSLLKVEVRSVGYLPRVYTLHSNLAQNKIVLSEDENTAKENVVVKDNASGKSLRRGIFLKDSSRVNVEPADGWDNYNTYIANSIDIPNNILQNERHGEVEISFKVNPNGAITNIKIYQSGCGIDCAELAKRLIEQGPQWVVKKGRKATARVKVQF